MLQGIQSLLLVRIHAYLKGLRHVQDVSNSFESRRERFPSKTKQSHVSFSHVSTFYLAWRSYSTVDVLRLSNVWMGRARRYRDHREQAKTKW